MFTAVLTQELVSDVSNSKALEECVPPAPCPPPSSGVRLTAPLVNKRQIWTCPRGMRVENEDGKSEQSSAPPSALVTWREEMIRRALDLSTRRTPVAETRYLTCETRICFAATWSGGLGEARRANCSISVCFFFFFYLKPSERDTQSCDIAISH